MSWLHAWRHRLRVILDPAGYERELDEEMRHHLELDAVQQGTRERAGRRFGNRTYYLEARRADTWLSAFDGARQDARSAWRAVARTPSFAAVVVATLALGIGANAAIFSLLDRLYLRSPAGITDPATLRMFWVRHFNVGDGTPYSAPQVSYPIFRELAAASGDAPNVAVFWTDNSMRLGRGSGASSVRGVYASSNYFAVLGVPIARGRFYSADEDRLGSPTPVVVVASAFADRSLGGEDSAIGRTLEIGRTRYTVIGVVAREFTGLDLQAADVWLPLAAMSTPSWIEGSWWENFNVNMLRAVQRVRPGVNEGAIARRATDGLRRLQRETRTPFLDTLTTVQFGSVIEARGPGKPGQELVIATRLGGVAAVVLAIASANVVNLLLARAVRRRRELAVRLAIGLPRWRLARTLVLEMVILASMAAVAAIVVGGWGGGLLRALLVPDVEWRETAMHWRTAGATVVVALVCGAVAGLIPALQASRPDLTGALKAGAREGVVTRSRLRSALVVAQAALSVMLLVGAALFVRSLRNVEGLDIGYDAKQLLFGEVRFPDGDAPPAAVTGATMREVAQRLDGRPGIESVARTRFAPMQGIAWVDFFTDDDSSAALGAKAPTVTVVTPDFFRTTGMRIVKGRGFTGGDVPNAPAEVVLNEAMAGLLWPGREPLGQCLRIQRRSNPCHVVVGVVANARRLGVIESTAAAQFYLPSGHPPEGWETGATLVVRAAPNAVVAATREVRAVLQRAFPAADVVVTPMTQNLEPEYRPWRLGATLFSVFGGLAVLVALVGIYSTVSYGVTQRTHEFGVRIALGAGVGAVLRQVIGEGVRTVAAGVACGVALAIAAGRLVSALLYGVAPSDPGVLAAVSVLVLAVTVLAALVPAWRAARVDPLSALRAE